MTASPLDTDDDLGQAAPAPAGDPVQPGRPDGRIQLAISAEAAEVFASLAVQCVPILCDSVIVDLTGIGELRRIAFPPDGGARHLVVADADAEQRVRFSFVYRQSGVDTDGSSAVMHGLAVFTWSGRVPTAAERLLATALVEQAKRTLAWQHSLRCAQAATERAEHLDIALQNSRRIGTAIGILMSLHKITEAAAFDLLRVASQRSHRKLRDVALLVMDTGWLDPDLVRPATSSQTVSPC